MVHGHKDFGQGQEAIIIHTVSDLGELASRLGSPNKFHRGGNVIFQTDFEHGLNNCEFSTGHGGASYYLTDAQTYSGGVACYLKNMGIDILTRPIELTKIGFEITWLPIEDVNSLTFQIIHDDGLIAYKYQFVIWIVAEIVQVYDSAGVGQTISTYDFNDVYINLWNINKIVVDIKAGLYDKIYFNDLIFDVSEYEPEETLSSGDKRLTCTFMCNPVVTEIAEVIIDNIIITINEP